MPSRLLVEMDLVGIREQSFASQPTLHAHTGVERNVGQVGRIWPPQPVKLSLLSGRRPGEDPIGDDNMIVDVEIEASAEALRKLHGSAAGLGDAPFAGPLALPSKDLLHEDPADGGQGVGTSRQSQPELERDAEHPLPQGNIRDDSVDEVCRSSAHAPSIAGWAHASAFTREGDQQALATRLAHGAKESMGIDPALQVPPQLLLDVPREPTFMALARLLEECLEVA